MFSRKTAAPSGLSGDEHRDANLTAGNLMWMGVFGHNGTVFLSHPWSRGAAHSQGARNSFSHPSFSHPPFSHPLSRGAAHSQGARNSFSEGHWQNGLAQSAMARASSTVAKLITNVMSPSILRYRTTTCATSEGIWV